MKTVQPEPVKSSYCFIEDCFIFSMDIDVLKFVIAHIQGVSGSSLSGDVDYTAAMGAVGPYHDIDFYVNIKQLVGVAVAEDSTGEAQGTLSNLGFDNVVGIGCAAGVGREADSSWGGKLFVKVNGAKRGICKMLEFESGAVKAPRFMPASAYAVMFVNLDIKKAYDELYNIIYKISPTSAAVMHTPLLPASPDGQPGVELKSDIIDYLGPEIVMAQSMKKPFEVRKTPTETLFAVGVRDRSGPEKSLSLLHNRFIGLNDPDAKRELLGATIYIVKLPNLPMRARASWDKSCYTAVMLLLGAPVTDLHAEETPENEPVKHRRKRLLDPQSRTLLREALLSAGEKQAAPADQELLAKIETGRLSAFSLEEKELLVSSLMLARNKVTHIYELVKAYGSTPQVVFSQGLDRWVRRESIAAKHTHEYSVSPLTGSYGPGEAHAPLLYTTDPRTNLPSQTRRLLKKTLIGVDRTIVGGWIEAILSGERKEADIG